MISPKQIISWLENNTKNFRRSRIKTLAALVSAAARKRGMGVLALGRSMGGTTCAKHRIKRAWRFFRNKAVQPQPVAQALLTSTLPPRGPIVLMIDWTDLPPWRTLVVGLAHRRRALPFMTITVPITGRGGMLAAEQQLLGRLRDMLPADRQIIIVADRGFGTTGWITTLETLGWGYVLRLRTSTAVHVGEGDGSMHVQRGSRARRHGRATVTDYKPTTTSLVSIWRADSAEPWLLATNLSCSARAVVRLYAKRMWIELSIRDLKNRRWGLGVAHVRLSEAERMDRILLVALLANWFLTALGVVAQKRGLHKQLSANTDRRRCLSLATLGWFLLLSSVRIRLSQALRQLPLEIVI